MATATKYFTKRGKEIGKIIYEPSDLWDGFSYNDSKVQARLNSKYKQSKVRWVLHIQDVFENYVATDKDEVLKELFPLLEITVKSKAESLTNKFRNTRLGQHDFESELWQITWDAIEYYDQTAYYTRHRNPDCHDYMLIETLEMFWSKRIINFIKSKINSIRHGQWYRHTLPLFEGLESNDDLEQDYIRKETVDEFFNNAELTCNERELLLVIYSNPDGSLREWGKEIDIPHPQTVDRLYKSLKKKVNQE